MYLKAGAKLGNEPETPENSLKNQVVAMSRGLAKTQSKLTVEQKKLLVMCMTKIKWSKPDNKHVVNLKKSEIIDALELKIDVHQQSKYLRKAFKFLAHCSMISWTDPEDHDIWRDDFLITGMRSTKNEIEVAFNPYYMPLLENLVNNTPYITIWSNDIYGFKSKFSFALFEDLRLHYDDRYRINYRTYSTKQLKELFGLDKDAYMREKGGFNRNQFERQTIDRAIKEINESEMISIMPNGTDTKKRVQFYEKLKEGGEVTGYRIAYLCRTRTDSLNEQAQKSDKSSDYLE